MLETRLNVQTYSVGSGAVFPFNVPFFDAGDIHCYFQAGDAEEIELVNGTDFTVEGKDNYTSGADITLAAKYVIPGATLAIAREVPELQTLSLPTNGKLPSKPMETQLDRHVAMIQQLHEALSRAAVLPITYLGSGGAIDANTIINKYLSGTMSKILGDYFYSSGTAIFNRYISSGGITTIELHDKALFEIFPAAATEKPQGAEKLDGTVLYNCADPESPYHEFYKKALEYARDGKISVVTQAQYTATIAQYGQCGSFVVDETIDNSPHSIKLPTVNGFIQNGTPGVVHNAGLPNISGTLPEVVGTSHGANPTGAFSFGSATGRYDDFEGSGNHPTFEAIFNAAAGNSAFGTADTVQPRSVEMCFFIQVAEALGRIIGSGGGVSGAYLPISGGTVTGNLDVEGFFTANGGGYIRQVSSSAADTQWALPEGNAFSGTYVSSNARIVYSGSWEAHALESTTITSGGSVSGSRFYHTTIGDEDASSGGVTSLAASNTPAFSIDSATGEITATLWGSSTTIAPSGTGAFVFSSSYLSSGYDDEYDANDTVSSSYKVFSGAIAAQSVVAGATEQGALVQPVSGGMVLSSWAKQSGATVHAEELLVSSGGAYLAVVSGEESTGRLRLATEKFVSDYVGSAGGSSISVSGYLASSGGWTAVASGATVGSLTLASTGIRIAASGGEIEISGGTAHFYSLNGSETVGFWTSALTCGIGYTLISGGTSAALTDVLLSSGSLVLHCKNADESHEARLYLTRGWANLEGTNGQSGRIATEKFVSDYVGSAGSGGGSVVSGAYLPSSGGWTAIAASGGGISGALVFDAVGTLVSGTVGIPAFSWDSNAVPTVSQIWTSKYFSDVFYEANVVSYGEAADINYHWFVSAALYPQPVNDLVDQYSYDPTAIFASGSFVATSLTSTGAAADVESSLSGNVTGPDWNDGWVNAWPYPGAALTFSGVDDAVTGGALTIIYDPCGDNATRASQTLTRTQSDFALVVTSSATVAGSYTTSASYVLRGKLNWDALISSGASDGITLHGAGASLFPASAVIGGGAIVDGVLSGARLSSGAVAATGSRLYASHYVGVGGARTYIYDRDGGSAGYTITSYGVDLVGDVTVNGNPITAGGGASGAIVSGAEFTTTVGGHTVTLTADGGFLVSGGNARVSVSGGEFFAMGPGLGMLYLAGSATSVFHLSRINIAAGEQIALHAVNISAFGTRFIASAGDYKLELTSGGGLVVSGNGASMTLASGTIVMDGGLQVGGGDLNAGGDVSAINVSAYSVNAEANVAAGGNVAAGENVEAQGDVIAYGGIYVNSRPVLVELETVIDSETTSASIAVLSGGTSFVFTQPLTSLSVASVESSMREAWIEFTVASGGSVSINDSGYKYLGGRPSAFEGGSSYSLGFRWGSQAVCAPLEE